ncbi:hypothetical protein [Algoriphagus taiwanensis]|uniref:hypothetical protein n=1 Tax=Algoriphagus taiwanensis TaxID=1445656 RepID=UPI0030C76269
MNKGGFSWKRLSGISGAKANVSRKIGIPLTKSGRDQKIGRAVSKGCMGSLTIFLISITTLIFYIIKNF